ncbi:MAG TPA: hypothetical protein VIJ36_06805 [Thermoanaerobaculia bacterium]
MTRPPTDREALIAALAEEARSGVTGEPEPEELLEFLAGRLPPEDERRVERQLAASPEAARALLDLQDLEAAGAAAGTQPTDLAVRAGWRDLQGRLPASVPWYRRLPPVLSSIAATLLLSIGTYWTGFQVGLHQLIANVGNAELLAGSRAADGETVALSAGASLRLVLSVPERCPRYRAEIEGPRYRKTVEGLKRDQGNVTLLLPSVASGEYRLRLSGCEPRRELQEYSWRVVRPSQPEADGD